MDGVLWTIIMPIASSTLSNPSSAFRPIAFWFLNHFLEEKELRRQIEEMAIKGLGGFMVHGRDGLRTPYLKADWKRCLDIALDEAEKHDLEIWLYDEMHYPSGSLDGMLTEEAPHRTMKSLAVVAEREIRPCDPLNLDGEEGWNWLAADKSTGEVIRLHAGELASKLPSRENGWYLVGLKEIPWEANPGHRLATYPDYLDPDLSAEFIQRTHCWYERHFKKFFGSRIRGIFSDNVSGSFGAARRAIPWSRGFPERFEAAVGKPMDPVLPALFNADLPGARANRIIFWRFFSNAFAAAHHARILEFCHHANLLSTGHLVLEDGMAEHIRQAGDYFTIRRQFSHAAVDQVGISNPGDPLFAPGRGEKLSTAIKISSSTARFSGSERLMCECFGKASEPWKIDLLELRRISGFLAALGVDQFLIHGFYYSVAGHRKWECTPDHLHNPIWNHYRLWSDWIARLSLLMAGCVEEGEIAVLYPAASLMAALELGRPSESNEFPPKDYGERCARIESIFRCLVDGLLISHVGFEIIDEVLLKEAQIDGPRMRIGKLRPLEARVLILPAVDVLERASFKRIEEFLSKGGIVIAVACEDTDLFNPEDGTLVRCDSLLWENASQVAVVCQGGTIEKIALPSNIPSDLLVASRFFQKILREKAGIIAPLWVDHDSALNLVSRSWIKDDVSFRFIFNISREKEVAITLTDSSSVRSCIDLESGQWHRFEETEIRLAPSQGFVVTSSPKEREIPRRRLVASSLLEMIWNIRLQSPNFLPLEKGSIVTTNGKRIYRYRFDSSVALQATLLLEQERSNAELAAGAYAREHLRAAFNGISVESFGSGFILDSHVYEATLPGGIRKGVNELEFVIGSNYLDWEYAINAPVIAGAFAVTLREPAPLVSELPAMLPYGSWVGQGLPFFSGVIEYHAQIEIPGVMGENGSIELYLGKMESSCECFIDTKSIGLRCGPDPSYDVTSYAGQSVHLSIRVANTANNLWMKEKQPAGLLSPISFRFYEKW